MKKSIVLTAAFLFLTVGLYAQNQFSLKIDTAKTGLLGFNKQNRWPLTLNDPIEYPDFKFQGFAADNLDEATSEWNMPVYDGKSEHPMPVHIPDSTINYSMIIVRPQSN